jgi:sporulation protein YlmC with PRC-barrel domain
MHPTQVYDSNGRLVGNVGNVDFIMNPHWKPSLIAAGPSESATKNSA